MLRIAVLGAGYVYHDASGVLNVADGTSLEAAEIAAPTRPRRSDGLVLFSTPGAMCARCAHRDLSVCRGIPLH